MPPFSLTDDQLRKIIVKLGPLDPPKRAVALERVAAQFRLAGVRRPSDAGIKNALELALRGLIVHGCAA